MRTLWHAITTFVLQNLPLIIGWLVFIGASALLAPFITQRIRRTTEKRDEHLAELKRDVLKPMLNYLSEHVFPILEHRCGNVGVRREFTHKPLTGVMENPIVTVESFCSYEANEPPIDPFVDARGGPAPGGVCGGPLYDDARQHHFRDLILRNA